MPRSVIATWEPDLLRALLRERGWKIGQLAIAMDSSLASVSNWLHRGAPSPAALTRIAAALEVKTTDLAPLSQEPTLHEYRWHAGLTVAELAAAIGLSPNRVSVILRGEDRITHPERWAKALGVSPDLLTAAWEATRRQAMPS